MCYSLDVSQATFGVWSLYWTQEAFNMAPELKFKGVVWTVFINSFPHSLTDYGCLIPNTSPLHVSKD